MLQELRVKNFGIIEEIDWRPERGLNVVTGETGTGKSLVIDALETLLSARSDESDIRHGADTASIEAVFDIWRDKPIFRRRFPMFDILLQLMRGVW